MNAFFPDFWNVIHDGSIDRISGSVPGNVVLHLDVEYLRERFADEGEQFVVSLVECSLFSFRVYEEENQMIDLEGIAALQPQILNAELDGELCRVFTDQGILEVKASAGSIHLDSGREITMAELVDEAKKYWDEWSSK